MNVFTLMLRDDLGQPRWIWADVMDALRRLPNRIEVLNHVHRAGRLCFKFRGSDGYDVIDCDLVADMVAWDLLKPTAALGDHVHYVKLPLAAVIMVLPEVGVSIENHQPGEHSHALSWKDKYGEFHGMAVSPQTFATLKATGALIGVDGFARGYEVSPWWLSSPVLEPPQ